MHKAKKSSRYRLARVASLGLIGATMYSFSFAAVAEIYPVDGVWTAINSTFPVDRSQTCTSLKIFGTESVSRKSITELVIFAKNKRFDVKGDDQNETILKSIKAANGGFWITESLNKRSKVFLRRAPPCL